MGDNKKADRKAELKAVGAKDMKVSDEASKTGFRQKALKGAGKGPPKGGKT
jgi:hypothetical protein